MSQTVCPSLRSRLPDLLIRKRGNRDEDRNRSGWRGWRGKKGVVVVVDIDDDDDDDEEVKEGK